MSKIKQYLISFISIIVGLVFTSASYLFLSKPLVLKIADTKAEISTLDSSLKSKQDKLEKLKGMKDKIEEYKKIKEKINSVIPTEKDLPKVYHMMEVIAAESGVKLDSLTVGSSQASTQSTTSSTPSTSSSFQEIQITIAITVPYDTVISYLGNLNSFVQITNINGISLTPDGDNVKASIEAYTIYNPTNPQTTQTPAETPSPSIESP